MLRRRPCSQHAISPSAPISVPSLSGRAHCSTSMVNHCRWDNHSVVDILAQGPDNTSVGIVCRNPEMLKNGNTHNMDSIHTIYRYASLSQHANWKQHTYLLTVCFQVRVSCFFSFFFQVPYVLYRFYCLSFLHDAPIMEIIRPNVTTFRGWRAHVIHALWISWTVYLQYTMKSSRKRLQPLGKKNRCRVCISSSCWTFYYCNWRLYTHEGLKKRVYI